MKKLLSMGLLTLCALAAGEREAQAWVNAKFSVGLNWQLQSANNNFLWGVYKNGQVPGPEAFGQGGGGGPAMYAPGGMQSPQGVFPFFGAQPNQQPMPQAQTFQRFPAETAPPALAQMPTQQQSYNYGAPNYYYNPYQTVSYQQGYYNPSYYPTYPQGSYGAGYGYGYGYQAPYYWYNNR